MDQRRMCPNCRAFITTKDKVCPYCDVPVAPRAIDVRSPKPILGGMIPQAHFVTVMILLINFGLFAATVLFSMNAGNADAFMGVDGRTLFEFGAKYRAAISLGQWWRLITAGFLHGGILHILMNSWVLFDLGAQVEEIYGASRMIVFYSLANFCGFLASTYWTSALSVGASAGLFGLIGAMIALGVKHKSELGAAIRGMYVRWAIYGLLIGLLPGLHMDNAAHIGGLAAGFAVAYATNTPKLTLNWQEKFWRVAAGVCVALTAFAFLQMFLWLSAGQM